MRRSARILANTLAWVSLGGFVAVLFLWATSYYHYRLFSHEGRVLVLGVSEDAFTREWFRAKPPSAHDWELLRTPNTWRFAGIEFAPKTTLPSYSFTSVTGARDVTIYMRLRYWKLAVPYWLLAVLAGVLPLSRLPAVVRRRARRREGRCLGCGYDLRSNTSGVCPECGKQVAPTPAAPREAAARAQAPARG